MKKIWTFILVLLSIFLISSTGWAAKDINEILQEKTREIKSIKKQLAAAEADKTRWETAAIIYQHYKENGTIYTNYWLTPEFLYSVVKWGQKYQYLAPNYNYDTINPLWFFLLWVANESNFDPRPECIYVNKTNSISPGSKDYWLMQMNECHRNVKGAKNLWKRADKLFPDLAYRPDSDPEKNVVVWYLWLNDQSDKTHYGVWDIFKKWQKTRKDVMELYARLKRVK